MDVSIGETRNFMTTLRKLRRGTASPAEVIPASIAGIFKPLGLAADAVVTRRRGTLALPEPGFGEACCRPLGAAFDDLDALLVADDSLDIELREVLIAWMGLRVAPLAIYSGNQDRPSICDLFGYRNSDYFENTIRSQMEQQMHEALNNSRFDPLPVRLTVGDLVPLTSWRPDWADELAIVAYADLSTPEVRDSEAVKGLVVSAARSARNDITSGLGVEHGALASLERALDFVVAGRTGSSDLWPTLKPQANTPHKPQLGRPNRRNGDRAAMVAFWIALWRARSDATVEEEVERIKNRGVQTAIPVVPGPINNFEAYVGRAVSGRAFTDGTAEKLAIAKELAEGVRMYGSVKYKFSTFRSLGMPIPGVDAHLAICKVLWRFWESACTELPRGDALAFLHNLAAASCELPGPISSNSVNTIWKHFVDERYADPKTVLAFRDAALSLSKADRYPEAMAALSHGSFIYEYWWKRLNNEPLNHRLHASILEAGYFLYLLGSGTCCRFAEELLATGASIPFYSARLTLATSLFIHAAQYGRIADQILGLLLKMDYSNRDHVHIGHSNLRKSAAMLARGLAGLDLISKSATFDDVPNRDASGEALDAFERVADLPRDRPDHKFDEPQVLIGLDLVDNPDRLTGHFARLDELGVDDGRFVRLDFKRIGIELDTQVKRLLEDREGKGRPRVTNRHVGERALSRVPWMWEPES